MKYYFMCVAVVVACLAIAGVADDYFENQRALACIHAHGEWLENNNHRYECVRKGDR